MRRFFARIAVLVVGTAAFVAIGGFSTLLATHNAVTAAAEPTDTVLAVVRTQLADTRRELDRAHQILEFSSRYGIPADLSAQIYDIAVAEGIPASVGFQLVKVESGFQNTAQSPAAAIGLTQLRVATARSYDATVDPSDLMNANVNLKLGFRYLKDLLTRFDQNLPLALEAYNKGPTFVSAQQDSGMAVEGRYSKAVMRGIRRRG
jgi:soluble lytic murein transglycosylase-like protein